MIRHEYDENPTINHNFTIGILMLEHANVLEYIIVHSNKTPGTTPLWCDGYIVYIKYVWKFIIEYFDTHICTYNTL